MTMCNIGNLLSRTERRGRAIENAGPAGLGKAGSITEPADKTGMDAGLALNGGSVGMLRSTVTPRVRCR
jgi:hypothetical protein